VLSNGLIGTIIGLRPQDGTTLWQRELGPSGDQHAHALSLGMESDSALFYTRYDHCQPPDSPPTEHVCQLNVYAVGVADGSLLWQRSVGSSNADFAFKLVYGNGTLYYQRFYDDSASRHYPLMALRGGDGSIKWIRESNGLFAQALARDGTIFATASACTPGQLTCAVFIEALRDRDGSVVWKRIFAPYNGTLVFAGWIELG
jgi:outer membrane protein assembly factor BamB